ncbi:hypothetical protein BT96DRAFT_916060 [Gymnopus androsaceus JB14]|uniref:Uncharacterized protein n=1 Tax=Gymnopus androsaceus JB14 TaxID=1447944 RepID=A0A6A4IA56_9AGAR|nr:hypothetical protein BT96DRAFT_916060 [Gymnopus androsaceus JB14]
MEDKRAQTLQALSTFIDKQRALLTRTHADIDRLNELRSRAIAHPDEFRDNISEELNDKAFKISELEEAADGIPAGIEWSLFAKHDPSPLQALAAKSKQQPTPTTSTSTKVSDFQKYIREAKSNILDPVFSTWNLSFDPVLEADDEENDPPPVDPAALKKAKEREKIKELKKHQIKPSGLTLTPTGHRTRGPGGVFIRRDLVDESMDVDISLDTTDGNPKPAESSAAPCPSPPPRPRSPSPTKTSRIRQSIAKACANTSSFVKLPSVKIAPPSTAPMPSTTRHRRKSSKTPSSCADDMDVDDSTFPPTPDSLPFAELDPEQDFPPEKDDDPPKVLGKRTRPKSETYKQAWSNSEQQLLEALLEEIPEGEKNRWKKISKAMNGRRTPRQVASRVQKYFEKLKKFGID